MPLNITPTTNHREREKGCIVYPVYSRRSEGLSVGINLFPDKKKCPFDCPYCEVFPFSGNAAFSYEQMEEDLRSVIVSAQNQNIKIRDICFSGNGEPTLSAVFPEAFRRTEEIRAEMTASSHLVVITNGAGLLQPQIFSILKNAACLEQPEGFLDIWLKLDAGTPEWYQKMNRTDIPFEKLVKTIKKFVSCAPVTIQTMLCFINGEKPPSDEQDAWETLVCELANAHTAAPENGNCNIRKVQLYGKARPAPEDPLASQLPDNYIDERTASIRRKFADKGITTPVEIYY